MNTRNMIAPVSDRNKSMELIRMWVDRTLSTGVTKLREEFMEIKKWNPDMDTTIFMKYWDADITVSKNRYKDVPCQEHMRVKITWPGVDYDYIHANYLPTPRNPKRFICTQGPLDHTVVDFWHMILLEKSESIIMLTQVVEKGLAKCAQYWPANVGEKAVFGDVTVVSKESSLVRGDKSMRVTTLEVSARGEKQEVRHYQWTDWPDRGVPPVGGTAFEAISSTRGTKKPIVIHCSAGIGRTGSIAAIAYVLERFQFADPCEDMREIVKVLRKHRPFSIQNDLQYLWVHRVILYYFHERNHIFDKNDKRYVQFAKEYEAMIA